MTFKTCAGCDVRLDPRQPEATFCPGCAANGGKPTDPYADLGEVYATETTQDRVEVVPTPRTPTDGEESEDRSDDLVPGLESLHGFHIDGDKRYQER